MSEQLNFLIKGWGEILEFENIDLFGNRLLRLGGLVDVSHKLFRVFPDRLKYFGMVVEINSNSLIRQQVSKSIL